MRQNHSARRAGARRVAVASFCALIASLVPLGSAQAATPTISISRGSVIGGESIRVTGNLGRPIARPVVLQRRAGRTWLNLISLRSSATGAFAVGYRPPTRTGSKVVIRAFAPRAKVAGRIYPPVLTGGRTVLTIGQKATLTVPSVVAQGASFAVSGRFTPARPGRVVVLQKPSGKTWVSAGRQTTETSSGAASVALSLGARGTFKFRLLAVAAGGAPAVASPSGSVAVTMPIPTALAATPGDGGVHLTWHAVTTSGLVGYDVYSSTDPAASAASWQKANSGPVSGTSYDVSPLTNGTKYYFAVTSVNADQEQSAFSAKASATPTAAADTTAPPAPTNVAASPGDASAQVSWSAVTATDLAGYNVYQGASASGPWTKLTSSPVSATGLEVTALTNNTQYFFAVTSIDTSANESAKVVTAGVTPSAGADTTPAPAPTGVTAMAGDASVQVSWMAVSALDLAGYNLYRAPSGSGPWTKVNSGLITATTAAATGLSNGTVYYFAVTSVDTSANESARSTAVSTTPIAPPTGWAAVSAGGQHTCAIGSNGTLYCWGLNRYGELGNSSGVGVGNPHPTPTQVGSATTWTSVAAGGDLTSGRDFTCGVQSNGTLWCWGNNKYGQLGTATSSGTDDPTSVPTQVGTGTNWSSVSAGASSTCALQTNGTAWCWGLNADGELGNAAHSNSLDPTTSPTQVGTGTTWSSISTGTDQTCATRTDHTLWCWGGNTSGQLGTGVTGNGTPTTAPVQVPGTAWSQVSAGNGFTCAVQTGGTAWCWGTNEHGQLGNATDAGTFGVAHPTPTKVGSATNWSRISAGEDHTCAVTTTGKAYCWGANNLGQLGSSSHVGTTTPTTAPVQVGTATTWSSIDAGAVHTCARTSTSSVSCWGSNQSGQLGVATNSGTTTANSTPAVVPLP